MKEPATYRVVEELSDFGSIIVMARMTLRQAEELQQSLISFEPSRHLEIEPDWPEIRPLASSPSMAASCPDESDYPATETFS